MKQFYTYVIVWLAGLLCCQTAFAARVMGIITSEEDIPIRKASIQISGFGSTTSNRNGIYLFKAVPAGHYWLIVKAEGYKTDSVLFSVNYKDVQVLNLTMHRTATVSVAPNRRFYLCDLRVFLAFFAVLLSPQLTLRLRSGRKEREG